MKGREAFQGIAGMPWVFLLAWLFCFDFAIKASPERSTGNRDMACSSAQENGDIALGEWNGPALSFRIVADGGALQIADFRYSYLHSCNKCSLKAEKIPMVDGTFSIESQAGQFSLRGTFQDGRRVMVRLRSTSKSCALDRSIAATAGLSEKSPHPEF